MSGQLSNAAELLTLDAWFGGVAIVPAANLYVALYTTAPTGAGGGVEVAGGSYARVAVANDLAQWPAAAGGSPATKTHANPITFHIATADWGLITAAGIFDQLVGGNFIALALIAPNKNVMTDDTASFVAGHLIFTLF